MEMKKTNGNIRGYSLMLVPYMGRDDYSFSCFDGRNLEEIDDFTKRFDDLEDMISSISYQNGEKLDVVNAYIKRISSKKDTRYQVMYRGDIFNSSKVVEIYKSYLSENPKYFYKESPVRFVRLQRHDYELESTYIKACCLAYFNKDNNYREVRGAYFELKKLGFAKLVLDRKQQNFDSGDFDYYSEDSYIDTLLNKEDGPDWDEIHNILSREDYERLVKKTINPFKGKKK